MRFLNWIKSLFRRSSNVASPNKTKYQWNEYWSEILRRNIFPKLATFDAASDITTLRPDWKLLTDEQKCEVLVQFFKSLAFYESGYNPRSESVDVGKRNNKETWSVGLLQLSGTDKETLKLPIGFDYEGLKDPENNLIQGIAIMVNQIRKRGKIIIPYWEKGNPGVYWATLNPGNSSHDQSKYIITDVRNLTFEKEVIMSDVPWMAIAEKELGVTETNNPKRVVEYHQATSLKAKDTATAWCFDGETEILTENGFIPFKELNRSHGKVAQVDQDTLEINFVYPINYIKQPYNGRGFEFRTRSMYFKCTEHHLFYGWFTNNFVRKEFRTVDKMAQSGMNIPKPVWIKEDNLKYSDEDLTFIAAFISDGFYKYVSPLKKDIPWRISFQVSKQRKIDELKKFNPLLCTTAKRAYGKSKVPLTVIQFKVPNYFNEIFEDYKILSYSFIYSLSERQCRHFLDSYRNFDGNVGNNGIADRNILYTSVKDNLDRLSLICTLSGYHSVVTKSHSAISGKPCWSISYNKKTKFRNIRKKAFNEMNINENVYCVEVPSGVFIARTSDFVPFISGNCSSFTNWVLKQAGYKNTNSAWARDWLDYGDIADKQRGAIFVFERNAPGGDSHVTFYTGKETATGYLCIGGNQANSVCIKEYPKKDLLGKRWPIK